MSGGDAAARDSRDVEAVVFTRAWSARAPLARVIEATRLERTPELPPLITRVERLEERGDASECWLHERIPLGPLRLAESLLGGAPRERYLLKYQSQKY